MKPDNNDAIIRRRILYFSTFVAILIVLAMAWSWSPLKILLDVNRIVDTIQSFGNKSSAMTAVFGLAVASTLAVPLSVITVIAVVAFGPLQGFAYTLSGACLGAAASYSLGSHLGHQAVERLAGQRIHKLSRQLANNGIVSVIALRLVPIAPFAIVNMFAGASHIRFLDYMIGTLLGMIPGTIAIIMFLDQIILAIREPGGMTILFMAITIALIGGGILVLKRWIKRNEQR